MILTDFFPARITAFHRERSLVQGMRWKGVAGKSFYLADRPFASIIWIRY